MDQASMHGETAVYLTDPIAQQHIVVQQSTTLYFDTHAEGKLVENPGSRPGSRLNMMIENPDSRPGSRPSSRQNMMIDNPGSRPGSRQNMLIENPGSRPGSRQNTDDSKMQQFVLDINTETSNVICKAYTELAQDGADESDILMTKNSISDTKPNDSDIRDKSDDSPGLSTSPDNATIQDSILMEKVTTSIAVDILTTEGIADDAEFQQNIHETDTESPHLICKQCAEPAQGANEIENTVIENHTGNSECLRFLEDIETAQRTNTICEECTVLGQGEGKLEISMAVNPMDNSKCPQFYQNCKSPRTISKEDIEHEQGADETENSMAESRTHNSECPRCFEELNNKSPDTICNECTQYVQAVHEVRNSMTEMSPRFVRDANNTESPDRFSKEWKELAQGASIIEDQTIALASDTKAEPGDVREKRSEMPEPASTARVDISDNEQSADKMSMDSPQFVEETRIESPTKTCEECIELAQGADTIENPTDAIASDTQAESDKFMEKRSETPEPAPDSGRVDNSDNEQFSEKLSIDIPQFVEETRIETPNKTCEECIELAQGADITEDPTEALASDTQAESDGVRETSPKTPHSPAYTPPDSGRVDNSDDEQFGEKLSIDSPHEFVEETRIEIPNETREECGELAEGAKYATESPPELAIASDYTQAEFEKRSETPCDSPASYTPPDSGRLDIISENEQNPGEMMTMDVPKFTISDVTKLAAEDGHVNMNESLINMCTILNPNRDDEPDKNIKSADATDVREGSGGSDDMSGGGLEILEKIEDLNTKCTEATQKAENLELNLWDLTEKIRLLQCKIEKQEQQINDAQSKQVEQERILLSPMRNIYLRQFHDQIREGIAKKLSKTALYADHHKGLCLRVQTDKEVSHRFGIEHFFDADLWSLMHEAHTRAPKVFSKGALWNHFVSDVLQDSALLEGELGLSAAAVRITKFGRSPDAENNSFKAQLRNKVVYAELITRQDEERRPAYSECYEFLFNVPPESMNNKPSFPPDDMQESEQSDAPNMQTMANVVEKSKQPLVDSGTSGEATESFSSTTSVTSEDSE